MPRPTDIKLHQKSRVLEIVFDDGFECNLTCEYLRVNSPSAEVQGHGPGQEVLQVGKQNVGITNLEPSGNYALKIWPGQALRRELGALPGQVIGSG